MHFHSEYEIINGSEGQEIKSIPVESHGETLNDRHKRHMERHLMRLLEHQELCFLPVLREHPWNRG